MRSACADLILCCAGNHTSLQGQASHLAAEAARRILSPHKCMRPVEDSRSRPLSLYENPLRRRSHASAMVLEARQDEEQ